MPRKSVELAKRDAARDLDAELLADVQRLRVGAVGRVTLLPAHGDPIVSPVAKVRVGVGLSQARFALLLGGSVRTLQQWEQGRREPTGAARALLRVAELHPQVLRNLEGA